MRNFLVFLALTTTARCARQLRLLVPAREALVHGHLRHIGFELEFLNMKLNMTPPMLCEQFYGFEAFDNHYMTKSARRRRAATAPTPEECK